MIDYLQRAYHRIIIYNNSIKSYIKRNFIKIKYNNHKYRDYEEYISHQVKKTNSPDKIKRWFNEEWKIKYDGFVNIFERNNEYLKGCNKAICLGARTGQEVKALLDIGIKAIGIDLVPFPPYTLEGDVHNLNYENDSFDFVFTNIIDHSLYPRKMCKEIERVLAIKGIAIIHIQLGDDLDEYTETKIYNELELFNYFSQAKVLECTPIVNTHDSMNMELIIQKNSI